MEASRYADTPPPPGDGPAVESPQPDPTHAAPALDPTTTAFQPGPPLPETDGDTDSMDQFAQTRAPDDLFDDDFTPIAEPATTVELHSAPRGRGGPPGRARGDAVPSGRGRGGRREAAPTEAKQDPDGPPVQGEATAKEDARPVSAVRGDRSGTGGVKKPKLSEDELSSRLASIKLKNAAREEAHRRAEADERSFYRREQLDQAKRKEERQNRQVMEGERERNRMRKLKAVQGREWDAEKQEEDVGTERGSGASQFRRGAHGGVSAEIRSHDGPAFDDRGEYAHRGSRGRGDRGRGRGRGRGGQMNTGATQRADANAAPPNTKADTDFPALPEAEKPKYEPSPQVVTAKQDAKAPAVGADGAADEKDGKDKAKVEIPIMSPAGEPGTWADQMEAGTPATPA